MPLLYSNPSNSTPIILCTPESLETWQPRQSQQCKNWITAHQFKATPSSLLMIPDINGEICQVLWGLDNSSWQFAALAGKLPKGSYHIKDWLDIDQNLTCLTWQLACYQFSRYKQSKNLPSADLVVPKTADSRWIQVAAEAITLVRDLINTPAGDLTPEALAHCALETTASFNPQVTIISGEQLKQGYPAIYTVGKAAESQPRLIDIKWSHPHAQKSITLVGKGVCFDSGGLDIKPASGMLTMKKDMGGGAHALALAYMIMKLELPLHLRVLIPAVENAISGNAMHPMDIIKTRKGLTVEIGNTDAEGRLILADALHEACQDSPDLVIDFATLTGAARVALGTDLPALFCNNSDISQAIIDHGIKIEDLLWPMPLHKSYTKHLKSNIADLSSTGKSAYGGAITAALFLEQFIEKGINWIHIDQMAWNLTSTPGKPEGGEAMGLLTLYQYLKTLTS